MRKLSSLTVLTVKLGTPACQKGFLAREEGFETKPLTIAIHHHHTREGKRRGRREKRVASVTAIVVELSCCCFFLSPTINLPLLGNSGG